MLERRRVILTRWPEDFTAPLVGLGTRLPGLYPVSTDAHSGKTSSGGESHLRNYNPPQRTHEAAGGGSARCVDAAMAALLWGNMSRGHMRAYSVSASRSVAPNILQITLPIYRQPDGELVITRPLDPSSSRRQAHPEP